MPRQFRKPESLSAERATRDAVKPFLEARGFRVEDTRQMHGSVQSQIVKIASPESPAVTARVKVCWRKEDRRSNGARYSASQLMFKAEGRDWDSAFRKLVAKELGSNVSHSLFVQWEEDRLGQVALVPVDQIPGIWQAQRAEFDNLILVGRAGRRTRNPSENGDSPTIYLQDDRTPFTPRVARLLWDWPGVRNLAALPDKDTSTDDTFDDIGDPSILGRDEGLRVHSIRSGFRRDPSVRRAVMVRARGTCERAGCGESRPYEGFLDVHHILGVYSSDRVWSCVALCPNCHREAHFSPDSEAINEQLNVFARQFQ